MPEIKQKYTGVIILNYNNYEDTINCIESVDTYNSSKIKFVIFDNATGIKTQWLPVQINKGIKKQIANTPTTVYLL